MAHDFDVGKQRVGQLLLYYFQLHKHIFSRSSSNRTVTFLLASFRAVLALPFTDYDFWHNSGSLCTEERNEQRLCSFSIQFHSHLLTTRSSV